MQFLKIRAQVLAKIRQFFAARSILEIETPLLYPSTATDPHIASFTVPCQQRNYYLQTSPEFAMKRLLAAGSGAIYQLCKAFRANEVGARHNPEFSLLEWYRPGFNHHQLMDEVEALLHVILKTKKSKRLSYRELFLTYLQLDPFYCSIKELQNFSKTKNLNVSGLVSKDDWLNLLLTHLIEPQLGFDGPFFIYDYPPSQAALAQIRHEEPPVAERFEVYIHGLELANGYHELANATEQRQRFMADNKTRENLKLPEIPLDEKLLKALELGLPPCAGVALGVDRLVMLAAKTKNITDVLTFSWERC